MPRSATSTGRPVSSERLPAMPTAIDCTPSRQFAGRASGIVARADEDVGEQDRVAAAVAAVAADDRNLDGRLPVALQQQALALGAQRHRRARVHRARVEHRRQALALDHGAALDDVQFDAAERAVHRDAVALPGCVRVERVAERGAVRVVDDECEVVFDRDALAEHVAVAHVPVVSLGVEVERLEVRVLAQVEVEAVVRALVRAAGGTLAETADGGVLAP